jgi:thioredoxin-like negative regulator of GroEL
VQAIPTLLIFKDGKLADRKVGAQPKKVLAEDLTKYN